MPETRAQRAKSSLPMPQQDSTSSSTDTKPVPKRRKLTVTTLAMAEELETSPGLQVAENSLIMENIFKHSFSYKDLKNFRQVSRLWYKETLQKWREMAIIRITSRKRSDARQGSERVRKGWDLADYFETLNDNDHFYKLHQYPYKKYHCIDIPFYNGVEFNDHKVTRRNWLYHTLKNFWNSVGPLVTHLELESCSFSKDTEETFEKLITERLPNLQSLVLTKNQVSNGCLMSNQHVEMNYDNAVAVYQAKVRNWNLKRIKLGGQLPMGLSGLMLNAPNIETLEFGEDLDTKNKHIFHLYFCFRIMYDYREIIDQRPFQIKNLDMMDLDFYKGPTHLSIRAFWMSTEYPVENLAMTLSNYSYKKIEDIQNMMIPTVRQLASTLKVLTVFRPPVYEMEYLDAFPVRMDSLEELYLHGNIVWNFDFLENMPNLKTLFIDFKCYEQDKRIQNMFYKTLSKQAIEDFRNLYRPYTRIITTTETVTENMEQLYLNFRPDGLVESIKTCMPGLKTLKAKLWQEEFKLVCQHFPNLEELVMLYASRIDDDTFTGFQTGSEERDPNNITSLKCLKKLEIQNVCFGSEHPLFDVRLGDKAVYRGLLELATLKSVTICASSEMTIDAENALKQHVASTKIIHNYEKANHKDKGEDCCRVKDFIFLTEYFEDFY